MGDTLWVLFKGRARQDDSDHKQMLNYSEELDALAEQLGQSLLTSFYDWTDYQFNLAEEDLDENWVSENEDWHMPALAAATLQALVAALGSRPPPFAIASADLHDLVAELTDCLQKLRTAAGEHFHFCVVM